MRGKRAIKYQMLTMAPRLHRLNHSAGCQAEPVATIRGENQYVLELTRLYATDEAIADGISLYHLEDFSLVVCKPDRNVIYSGCQWSAIGEDAPLGDLVYESLTLVARSRMEVRP